MSNKRFFTDEEVLREVYMNSDSEDSDEEIDDSVRDPDFSHENSTVSDHESDNDGEHEPEPSPMPSTSTSGQNKRSYQQSTRQNKKTKRSGRGSQTADVNIDDWIVPDNGHGSMTDVEFEKVSQLLEDFSPSSTVDVMPFFHAFLDEDMFALIAAETNRYADQVRAKHPSFTHLTNWEPVTTTDIKAVLALLFTMGIVKKPGMKLNWSTNPIIETPFFSKVRTYFNNLFHDFISADVNKH